MAEMAFLGTVAGLYFPLVVSPGPNFLVVTRAAMGESRRHGVVTAAGISSGSVIWATLAATGIGLLMTHFSGTLRGLQGLGGLYLLYMGLMIWRHARREVQVGSASQSSRTLLQSYWCGLSTCLTNPQALVFFSSMFASVFTPDIPTWARVASVLTVGTISVSVYMSQATLFSNARMRQGYQRAKRWIDLLCGGLFVAVGIKLVRMALGF
ncbi:LysE family translocator [Leeia oryzae]|uniref:LysE family translocator n=1 Tax=Leeia oryzae TaxID=356662 RepID=UPI00036E3D50|nr:LysE family transporter [Leeia oryzae]